jgi:hypothetical protein
MASEFGQDVAADVQGDPDVGVTEMPSWGRF